MGQIRIGAIIAAGVLALLSLLITSPVSLVAVAIMVLCVGLLLP